MPLDLMQKGLLYVYLAFIILGDDINFAVMNQTFCILGGILTIVICYVAFYVARQIVKRSNRRNIDIPDFLISGDNPVNPRSRYIDADPPTFAESARRSDA